MEEIIRHYGETGLYARIVSAAEQAGLDVDGLTVEDLGPVDESHIGGRIATDHLLDRAGIPSSSRVLDVGSGLGGTARHLAATGSHNVVGVDLTPEYVGAARELTRLTGLDATVTFVQGSAYDLPLPPGDFDAAVLLHVGMNLDSKVAAFREISRVLVDGGTFAIYDIMGSRDAKIHYPVPWAAAQTGSFLATASEYVEALQAAGFVVEHIADRSDYAKQFFAGMRQRSGPPPHLGLHLLMGPEAPLRYGNMVDAVESGLIAPTEIVASRRDRAA